MITPERIAEANSSVKEFMTRLSAYIKDAFPHQAMALNGELAGTRLTVDRWNRIAAVLASLHSVPGYTLGPEEHDRRNAGLAAVHVATRMAGALLGAHHSEDFLEFAVWRARDLNEQI